MKIGLFGDSFAHDDETKTGKSYIEYLNERKDTKINNEICGTNFDYYINNNNN